MNMLFVGEIVLLLFLCLFVYSGVQYIVLCFWFACLCLVSCCQFLRIVPFFYCSFGILYRLFMK